MQKVFLFQRNKITNDCSLASYNSMKINSITGNSNEDVDECTVKNFKKFRQQ